MLVEAFLCGLAGWRLASLLVREDGPDRLFARLRHWLGVPLSGEVRGFFPELLSCVWCASVWTTALAWLSWEMLSRWPVGILGAAAVAVLVDSWQERAAR